MNFKKIGIVLFTVLFVGGACLVPCFAEYYAYDEEFLVALNDNNNDTFTGVVFSYDDSLGILTINFDDSSYVVSGDGYLIYVENYQSSNLYFRFLSSGFDIEVEDDNSFDFSFDSSLNSYVIGDSGSIAFHLSALYDGDIDLMQFYVSYNPMDENDSFSVFDSSHLIGIIGNIGTLIFSSPILIVLFFVGVTCSLGFVAIRVIRKVMWGN